LESETTLKHSRGLIMAGLLIGSFVGMFSESALNIALSQLMIDFSVSAATVQWLTTGYLLVVGIFLPMSGFFVQTFTTRQLLFTALSCFLLGLFTAAIAVSFPVLLLGRLIQGIATGILLPLVFNTALAIYPVERRGTAMGIIGLVVMFAPAIGPTVGGFILGHLTWNWIFWCMLPVIIIAFIISAVFVENVRPITKPKLDVHSLALSTVGFGLIVFGVSFAGDRGWNNVYVLVSLAVGALALILFCHRQLRLETPFLNISAFKHFNFSLGTAMVFVDNAILMSAVFLIPMYLQQGKSADIIIAGLLMLPGGIVNGIVSAFSGRLFDKHGAKLLTRIGFLIAVIGAFLLFCLDAGSPYYIMVLGHITLMIGAPLAMSPAQTHGLNALPQSLSSDGSCIVSTLQQIAGAIGTALAASFMYYGEQTYSGPDAVEAIISGVKLGFALPLSLACIGFLLSLKIGTKKLSVGTTND